MRHKDKIIATVTAVVAVAVIICAIVIACMRLGIVEGYDFGAGAYYYADIPDFKDIVREDVYQTDIPIWVHSSVNISIQVSTLQTASSSEALSHGRCSVMVRSYATGQRLLTNSV